MPTRVSFAQLVALTVAAVAGAGITWVATSSGAGAYPAMQATHQLWCQSQTTAAYTDSERAVVESAASKWLDELPAKLAAEVDSANLPGPKGQTIWDELRELRDPGCTDTKNFGTGPFADRTDRHSFALWEQHAKCLSPMSAQKLGGMDGDLDVRGLCSFKTALKQRSNCVVYAAGVASETDIGFERSLVANTNCTVFSFDCTMGGKYSEYVEMTPGRHHFYPYCVSSLDGHPSEKYMTVATIAEKLGHSTPPALLKMDIEAFEQSVLHSWKPSDAMLPEQLNLEVHCTTEPISGRYRHLSTGELSLLKVHLYRIGYRLAHLTYEGGGVGATFVRMLCPNIAMPTIATAGND